MSESPSPSLRGVDPAATHVILLPVKPPAVGKSRMRGIAESTRRDLAEAFALDTAAACLATPYVGAVLVVTDDAAFSRDLRALGCAAIPDGVSDDLNGTLRLAAAEAARRWPQWRPAALCGDLPALRSTDLAEALSAAPAERQAFVADASGDGTTLVTAPAGLFRPEFGFRSAHLHADAGAESLPGELRTLRHDVDTLDDLRIAADLGLGSRTAAVWATLR